MIEPTRRWFAFAFIGEEVAVHFDQPPLINKKPDSPSGFSCRGESFQVTGLISRWTDYERRGRMRKNMRPEHLRIASKRGSWGAGRVYYRLQTECGRVFDLYYDRAPTSAGDRQGHWILWREMAPG
jgi:hypothetical protein